MKVKHRCQPAFLLVVICIMLSSMVCRAQTRPTDPTARPAGPPPVAIRKMQGIGRDGRILTPRYTTSISGTSKALKEWGRIRVEYATRPEWIDDLTIRFFALGAANVDGRNAYSLYRKEVRYLDIERENEHIAEVYIRPSALERYGEIVAVAVEFVVDGNIVAQAADPEKTSALPEEWWKDPRVVKSEAVTVRDAHILNRKESPFAYVNIQDFEAIR